MDRRASLLVEVVNALAATEDERRAPRQARFMTDGILVCLYGVVVNQVRLLKILLNVLVVSSGQSKLQPTVLGQLCAGYLRVDRGRTGRASARPNFGSYLRRIELLAA
jgi:hypothetical protein